MEVKVGQLWQEADNRHVRKVRVLAVLEDTVVIVTESDSWKTTRKFVPTRARLDRFKEGIRASHSGYFYVSG